MLLAALVAAVVSVVLSYRILHFSTDRTDLLDPNQPVQKSWQHFRQEFGKTNDFIVLIQGGSTEERTLAVEALARELEGRPDLYDNLFYRLDLPGLAEHALYFLSTEDLVRLSDELSHSRAWLELLGRPDGFGALIEQVSAFRDGDYTAGQLRPVLGLLNRVLGQLVHSLESRGRLPYQSPFGAYRADIEAARDMPAQPGQTRFYNTLGDGRTHVLVVRAREGSGNYQSDVQSVAVLRTMIAEVLRSYPALSAQLSGEPVINTDEMVGARRDAVGSALLSIVCVNAILTLAFGAFMRPQMVVLSLLFGLSWSFGFAALAVGKLNLITVNFATILVGLGMTFGIHVLYRFEEERAAGYAPFPAMERTLIRAGEEDLVGALTTAVAFWALRFTSFRSAGELGVIAGVGVMLCFVAMLTVLPSLLCLYERDWRCPDCIPHAETLSGVEQVLAGRPWLITILASTFSLYSLSWAPYIPFDYNVLNMQPRDAEAIRVEHYLQARGYSTLYAISLATTPEEAAHRAERFKALPTVSRVESVVSLMPTFIEQKQLLVEKIVRDVRGLKPPPAPRTRSGEDLLELSERFKEMEVRLDQALPILEEDPDPQVRAESRQTDRLMDRLQSDLERMSPGPVDYALSTFEKNLTADLAGLLRFLMAQHAVPPDVLGQLPPALKMRSISRSGLLCLRIFPKGDCWEREPLERFVHQLEKIDPNVTGTPVLIYYYLEELRDAYSVSGRNALIVICILLLLHFRSLRLTALALLPKLVALLWMLGIMGAVGMDFNPANFMALPLTLGIGLIFGVHVLKQCQTGRSLFECATGPAIVLSGLTTIVGFVTLLTAEHRGISSLGFVMAVGVAANLVTSLVMLPAVLTLLKRRGWTPCDGDR